MSTPSQLTLYNGALVLLGEEVLASLGENREPRRVLDNIWDRGAIDTCLEQGIWNFAMRTVKAEYDPELTPDFGFQYVFLKPSDWIKTAAMSSDEFFRTVMTGDAFRDEAGYWFTSIQTIYIRYVSNGASYGQNYTLWPKSFERFVESYLAKMAGPRIKGVSADRVQLAESIYEKLASDARGKDASNDGPMTAPNGSWVNARRAGSNRGDRGSRTQLIG